ncbi:hypothetical protein TNCV_1853041 [Trichonephila clavipes]|nr:hypothetical protein TNCV_1853041 [Trichonephila clavipes]
MWIYPPSNKRATTSEDAIANAIICCDCLFPRLRQQVQQLQGMKIGTLGWNTRPFFPIPAISNIVMTVSEIRFLIFIAHPEIYPVPNSASLILQAQSLKETQFSRSKTFRVSFCHGPRNRQSPGIIWKSYGNFSDWISYSDCPFRSTPETKFLGTKTFKVSPCHGVSKIWPSGIIRQSYGYLCEPIRKSDFQAPKYVGHSLFVHFRQQNPLPATRTQ